MTITHSYTKLVAVAAGVAVAFALVLGAAAPVRAAALTSGQISSIIGLLQSFGADAATIANVQASLNGTAPTMPTMPTTPSTDGSMACKGSVWARDLTVGATGADVMALQKFLNMSAATQVAATGAGSPGMETSTFGPATRAAVIKFQTANAITPAAGYVGPVTRTAIAAKCGTTPTTPGTPGTPGTPTTPTGLKGGEGQLDNFDSLGDVESDVDEGDSGVKVLGVEFDAKDSDLAVQRVDVEFDTSNVTGNASSNLDRYIESVSLLMDGKKIASMDVNEASEEDDVYTFRFSGFNGVVREGDTSDIYVSVDAVSNVDADEANENLTVSIPADGIRAVDAAGISETYDSAGFDEVFAITETSAGTLDISEGDENPEDGYQQVDSDSTTDDVVLVEFDMEADQQDITVTDFPVGLVVTGATNVGDVVQNVKLMKGSTVLKTKTIPSGAGTYAEVVFTDIDVTIEDGDTETFSVVATIKELDDASLFDSGDTLTASTTEDLVGWDVEDADGENVDPEGAVEGGTLTFQESGLTVTLKGTPTATVQTVEGSADQVAAQIQFTVTAGSDEIWIDGDVVQGVTSPTTGTNGIAWATTTNSSTGTSSVTGVLSASGSDTSGDVNNNFRVKKDQSRDFTFNVTVPTGIHNGAAGVRITGIKWDIDNDGTTANLYNFSLGDYKTPTLTGLQFR